MAAYVSFHGKSPRIIMRINNSAAIHGNIALVIEFFAKEGISDAMMFVPAADHDRLGRAVAAFNAAMAESVVASEHAT